MRVRAPGATRRKTTPTEGKVIPTEEQARELTRLMKAASTTGTLWKWVVDPPRPDTPDPTPTVRAEVWKGTKLMGRVVYSEAEAARLGPMFASDVMSRLGDPWTTQFTEGIK